VLTGGNGRPGNVGQDNYFAFNVPAGTPAVSAALALGNDPAGGPPAWLPTATRPRAK
jgi:hypothetical protein